MVMGSIVMGTVKAHSKSASVAGKKSISVLYSTSIIYDYPILRNN